MIKTITKRDNVTIEPFTPAKLINWGEWASRSLPGRGNWWHEVISEVLDYFKGQENVHSQVLQKTLISLLLRRGTWPANKMAGRLYAASLHKELYGELMPTVRALHHKLVKVGLMAPQPYTPQEYAIVETFIDHERDFDLAHSQIHQNRKKYALRPQTGKDEYETPQFIFMRMAMAAASNEPKDTRMLQVLSYYNQFSLAKVNPPSPNYINFGTHHHGYASCCLVHGEDTIDSLAIHDHIAYVMTGMSAGIGTVIHTRGPGEPVRNGAISHQGKAGYYQALGKATKANIQAGRGGACNTFFSAYDPEAMLHTNAQSQLASDDKKNRDIKFTINFNQFFAKKAAKAEPIFHFTPRTQPQLWKLLHSADRQGFENLYNKIDADPNIPKTYMDARDFIIYAGLKSNEISTLHYMFIDECNRHTPFDEPINSSNLCVAPETEILTKDGNLPIAPLVNQNVTIWNGYEWSEVTVKKTSDRAALIKVVTSRGTLECTPYHKFDLKPEGIDDTADDIEVKASSLKAGLELKAYKDHQTGEWLSNKVLDVIDEGRFDATYCFTEPKRHLGVFNGILTGQCVEIVEPTHAYRHMTDLYSEVDNGFIRFMDKLGVERTIPHSDRVVVWRDNKQKITYAGSLRKNDTVMESQGETIVQAEGMVEVSQVLEHKPTSEVALCSLAAIPVCNINSDDEYFKAAYDSLKMIDYCIHRSTYKLPHVGYTAKMRMNAAIGMMGVSTVLARKGLKYGSKEGRAEIHRLSERHAYFVIKASLAIAKERGNAPWIHKTKWPEGWLPIDTYNRNVDELTDEPLHYDWEKLRSEIIAQGGIAHSVVIAHMPTESSSKASGVPRSVMPIEEVASKRSDSSNVVDWVALDSDLYEYESAYDVETMDMIAAYAIMQKFTDQAISADLFIDRNHKQLKESDILNEFFAMVKYGIKTRYYQQTKSYTRKVEAAGVHPSIAEVAQAAGIVLPDTERPAKEAPKPPEPFEIQEVASAPTIAGLSIDFEDTEDTSRGCGSGACTI